MSEFEKSQRDSYQKRRKRWIKLQSVLIFVLAISFLVSSFLCFKVDKETYVAYAEDGNVIHRAYLKNNDFYEETHLNGSHAYVSSLIDKMTADFSYNLEMETDNVHFQYAYRIDAQIEIKDKASNSPIYNPIETILPETREEVHGKKLSIKKLIEFDYSKYNQIADEFVTSFGLKNTSNTLILRMHVEVVGASESFANDNTGEYVIELRVPLLENTVKPSVSTTVPTGAQSIVAKDTDEKATIFLVTVILGSLTVIFSIFFWIFIIKSRDKHIDYARRVKLLVSNYKSFIQKILDEYDTTGHQVIRVDAFIELLEIRDTIRQPVFMYENEDKTCTRFFVVTCLKTIYIFEIKVEDDSVGFKNEPPVVEVIPSPTQAATPVATEFSIEETSVEENTVTTEECPAEEGEAMGTEIEEFPTEYFPDEAEDAIENEYAPEAQPMPILPTPVEMRYRRSYLSRLIQAEDEVKSFYSDIKNELLSYKGVKAKATWSKETFRKPKTPIAKMDVKGKMLYVYFAINAAEITETKYRVADVSAKRGGEDYPTLLKVKSERSKKYALEIIKLVAEKLTLQRIAREPVDFKVPYEDMDALIERGLIKVLLPKDTVLDENTVTVKASVSDLVMKKAKP